MQCKNTIIVAVRRHNGRKFSTNRLKRHAIILKLYGKYDIWKVQFSHHMMFHVRKGH